MSMKSEAIERIRGNDDGRHVNDEIKRIEKINSNGREDGLKGNWREMKSLK